MWFALQDATLYLLSGGGTRSDWVRNLLRDPSVRVEIGGMSAAGRARLLHGGAEEQLARRLWLEKYQPAYGGDLSGWAQTATPVAVDLLADV